MSKDNKVTINFSGLTQEAGFKYTGEHNITGGKSFDGVSSSGSNYGLDIDAKADRSKSSGPWNWLKDQIDEFSNAKLVYTGSAEDEINFAFNGTLTLNGEDFQITLGQGSNKNGITTDNNWYLASSSLNNGKLTNANGATWYVNRGGNINSFSMSPA